MNTISATENLATAIARHRVFAILRHMPDEQLLPVLDALVAGGIRLLEITMNSADAVAQLERASDHLADGALLGAGTVTNVARARDAIAAGARFLVSPNLDLAVLALADKAGVPVVPGVMTPSEMVAGMQAGAAALKLFPAGRLGTGYVKDVRAALDDAPLVAVGGVTAENAVDWIRAGCIGVGVGSSLLDATLLANNDMEGLQVRARALVQSLAQI